MDVSTFLLFILILNEDFCRYTAVGISHLFCPTGNAHIAVFSHFFFNLLIPDIRAVSLIDLWLLKWNEFMWVVSHLASCLILNYVLICAVKKVCNLTVERGSSLVSKSQVSWTFFFFNVKSLVDFFCIYPDFMPFGTIRLPSMLCPWALGAGASLVD